MQLAVNIMVLAAIYALIACGYVLVYRVSRVLNLAHGELMMLGAYMLLATASLFAGNPLTAIAAALALSLLVGILVYVLLMRKMTGEMVVGAAAIPGPSLGCQQSSDRASWRSAHLELRGASGRHHGDRLRRAVSVPAVRPLGRANAGGWAECAAGGATRHQSARHLRARLEPVHADRIDCRHADRARFRSHLDHGDHRPQGLPGGPGRRARQSRRRAGRGPDRRRGGSPAHPPCRPAALRCGAVPGADRHADRAPVGPVRHARGARSCLGRCRAPAAISAPTMRRTWRWCRRGCNASASVCSQPRWWPFRSSPRRSSSISPARSFLPLSARCR